MWAPRGVTRVDPGHRLDAEKHTKEALLEEGASQQRPAPVGGPQATTQLMCDLSLQDTDAYLHPLNHLRPLSEGVHRGIEPVHSRGTRLLQHGAIRGP